MGGERGKVRLFFIFLNTAIPGEITLLESLVTASYPSLSPKSPVVSSRMPSALFFIVYVVKTHIHIRAMYFKIKNVGSRIILFAILDKLLLYPWVSPYEK